jgi:TATA-box binding protein (TBP) (component of TFIID and TFIIIB)
VITGGKRFKDIKKAAEKISELLRAEELVFKN